jgi:hypothetical protein
LYIIKIQGKAKIPDYVQLRDDQFTLIAYFRADRPEKAIEKCGFSEHMDFIKNTINTMPFGKMQHISLDGK